MGVILRSRRGFTLAELLIALAVMGIIAGAATMLLRSGLAAGEHVENDAARVARAAKLLQVFRADVGASSSILEVRPDELRLQAGPGRTIRYFFDPGAPPGSLELYRHLVDLNTGVDRTQWVGSFSSAEESASLQFEANGATGVQVMLSDPGFSVVVVANPWVEP